MYDIDKLIDQKKLLVANLILAETTEQKKVARLLCNPLTVYNSGPEFHELFLSEFKIYDKKIEILDFLEKKDFDLILEYPEKFEIKKLSFYYYINHYFNYENLVKLFNNTTIMNILSKDDLFIENIYDYTKLSNNDRIVNLVSNRFKLSDEFYIKTINCHYFDILKMLYKFEYDNFISKIPLFLKTFIGIKLLIFINPESINLIDENNFTDEKEIRYIKIKKLQYNAVHKKLIDQECPISLEQIKIGSFYQICSLQKIMHIFEPPTNDLFYKCPICRSELLEILYINED